MANATTPFPLGAYIGQPDNSSASNSAAYTAEYDSFTQLMNAAPQFLDYYIDQSQPITQWLSNAQWAAASAAQSPAKSATPVIGLPLTSTASSLTPDQQYQAFASGKYDSVIQSLVQAWTQQGFTTQYWRPGWEMNISSMPSYAGTDAQTQADWVKAFQHVSSVLHQAGTADGVNVQVVWNPSTTNYDPLGVLQNLYPGNAYVDVIGADVYADMYPYSPLYDWDKNDGTVDSSLAQFVADPVNRLHYWNYPAATPYALDGSGGHNLDLQALLAFAKTQGKPFAIPETGAGNSDGGHDVSDDGTFPQWLAQTLQASGDTIRFVNLWDSNGGGNFEFSRASDNKPQEAAAWEQYFGAQPASSSSSSSPPATTLPPAATGPVVIGSGSDTIALSVSEDAWNGDAQFTVSVDGTQVGGTQTATASHAAGADQVFDVKGTFGSGAHTVTVDFLNDAYGGTPSTDRNLYVDGATYDGTAVQGAFLSLHSGGPQSFQISAPGQLTLAMSEDAWNGDAQFTVSVDGTQVGGVNTVTALHASGATQTFTFGGSWSSGSHTVAVDFLNDAYGGTPSTDRNLYVDGAVFNGHSNPEAITLLSAGTQSFTVS